MNIYTDQRKGFQSLSSESPGYQCTFRDAGNMETIVWAIKVNKLRKEKLWGSAVTVTCFR